MIKLAKKFSSKIIFIEQTPVDEEKTVPLLWDSNKVYKNEFIEEYNKVIKDICLQNKVYFVEVYKEFKNSNYKNLLDEDDGIHLNEKGHQKVFEIVKDFLINKLHVFG